MPLSLISQAEHLIYNAWSDAAREASLLSRQAKGKSKEIMAAGNDPSDTKLHQQAADLHGSASIKHAEAAEEAITKGMKFAAARHGLLARKHTDAMIAHEEETDAEPGAKIRLKVKHSASSGDLKRMANQHRLAAEHHTEADSHPKLIKLHRQLARAYSDKAKRTES